MYIFLLKKEIYHDKKSYKQEVNIKNASAIPSFLIFYSAPFKLLTQFGFYYIGIKQELSCETFSQNKIIHKMYTVLIVADTSERYEVKCRCAN